MASPSRDITSTADGALTVRSPTDVCFVFACTFTCSSKLPASSLVTPVTFFREETVGNRPVAGDEYSIQVLVLFPEGQLQQEDV